MQPLDAVAVLSALASDQFGLVTSAQAREHGVGGAMLRRLLDALVLLPVARGVYRAAAAPEPAHLEIIVAWLRLDPARAAWRRDGRGRDDAVVSHSSACVLIGLGELPHPRVELTVPRRRRTLDPAVRLHVRIGAIEPDDLTVACGLPVTTAARTIADLLRESADGGHVGGVIAAAADRGLVDPVVLGDRVAVFAGRYGMRGAPGHAFVTALAAQAGATLPGGR